jgi:hypothetical protein
MKSLLLVALGSIALLCAARAENLLQNASFESPTIQGRTPVPKGANPALVKEGETSWTSYNLEDNAPPKSGGVLTIGMTDEVTRTGKQALFVDFEKLTTPGKRAMLLSDLLPIQPEKPYRISIWGRLDRNRPLAMDERRPHMIVSIEYYGADAQTQIGETDYRTQMIPGSILPNLEPRILFFSSRWSEYFTVEKSPAEAAFMKITWYWETPREEGETDGVIYWDDATVEGERGTISLEDAEKNAAAAEAAITPPAAPTAPVAPATTAPAPVQTAPAPKKKK